MAEDAEPALEAGEGGAPFSKNDVNFLRSLRISVEGEDDETDLDSKNEAESE